MAAKPPSYLPATNMALDDVEHQAGCEDGKHPYPESESGQATPPSYWKQGSTQPLEEHIAAGPPIVLDYPPQPRYPQQPPSYQQAYPAGPAAAHDEPPPSYTSNTVSIHFWHTVLLSYMNCCPSKSTISHHFVPNLLGMLINLWSTLEV